MASFIRKNSPTVAKGVSNEQEQLKVNAAGELLVNVTGGGTLPVSGKTSFSDSANNPVLSTAMQDDDAGTPIPGDAWAPLISAYNETNTSFRYIRQGNANGLNVSGPVVRNPQAEMRIVSGTDTSIGGAVANAIASTPVGTTTIIEIINVNILPTDATYSNFTCSIIYVNNL